MRPCPLERAITTTHAANKLFEHIMSAYKAASKQGRAYVSPPPQLTFILLSRTHWQPSKILKVAQRYSKSLKLQGLHSVCFSAGIKLFDCGSAVSYPTYYLNDTQVKLKYLRMPWFQAVECILQQVCRGADAGAQAEHDWVDWRRRRSMIG